MFRNILNKFFPPKPIYLTSKSMANAVRLRYLPNDLPDFESSMKLEVPQEEITKQIFRYIKEIKQNVEPNERNGKDGLYLGSAGIAYMFYHLSKIPALYNYRQNFLKDAKEYLQPALKVCSAEINERDKAAFLLGNAGVYAVASAVFYALGENDTSSAYTKMYKDCGKVCKDLYFLKSGSDELFVGRAGYLCGALWIAKETKNQAIVDDISDICKVMIQSGRQFSSDTSCAAPLMYSYYDVEYIGAAHGISSILHMLMSVPGYLDANPRDATDVKSTVDYVLSLQDKEGNFPAATDEIRMQNNELVHWCHGAGGIVYMLAKAYLIWNEEKYLNGLKRAADLIWEKGLLRKGPGICHGVAGNGYVFFLMYRLTEDPKYMHRAIQFASFLEHPSFVKQARVPDNPFSLYEGTAGTVCFLADFLQPAKASFPFSDVV